MRIQECTIEEINGKYPNSLTAIDIDEIELIKSISKLLYKTKSVRRSIEILDAISSNDSKYLTGNTI